ncbi:PaaX family transcriptional regulator [Actinacidiphila yeochonensis]|uniref:PaaX family transcriptional regulator n=1 Tax=Actinacidiphila yeochonensis TaxID=89050 RepID=UPI00056B0494|nr:PaaX family transcriptional regulator C-terminal domain-containing protein [Actinacidiphila yeochonensis]
MKPRQLVFELFGDYLRHRTGEVRLRGLVAVMACFGIPDTTVRVVVARMRKEGLLAARREGRETVYSLTDAGRELLEERGERIFGRAPAPWDGRWHLVTYSVPETERLLREHLRRKLARHGFGALSPALWVNPHDRTEPVLAAFADQPAVRLDVFRSDAAGPEADRSIAARAWDLAALDRAYASLLAAHTPALAALRGGGTAGRTALTERVTLIHDFRPIVFTDPDLPPELLPADWHGGAARAMFLESLAHSREPAHAFADELVASA